jgi:predicted nucleotidyltransferase
VELTRQEQAALEAFCIAVRTRFGERVQSLALFGSRARGDVHEDSDIDVHVAVDGLTWQEKREVYGFAGDVLGSHDVLLSPLVMSTEHFAHLRVRERAIAEEIGKDGIPL